MNMEPASVLDDIHEAHSADPRNMLRLINELPEQFETAQGVARFLALEEPERKPDVLYLTGTGAASEPVELAGCVLGEESVVPVVADCACPVPRCVGPESLAIVADYTGRSEMALRRYKEARSRGAAMVCITSGGPLLEEAADGGITVRIPPGQPPRTAPGYLMIPILVLAERMGLATTLGERLSHAIKGLKNSREWLRMEYPSTKNAAKLAATSIAGRLPVLFAATGYREVLARRWQSQIGANSKMPAILQVLPNALETGLAGIVAAAGRPGAELVPVFLTDPADRGELADSMSACIRRLEATNPVVLEMQGSTTLEKAFYGLYLGEYLSYYLALLNRVDPRADVELYQPELEPTGKPEGVSPDD